MYLLHNIGVRFNSNYNTHQEVLRAVSCEERLSFDGVYLNVWENRHLFDKLGPKKPILFVMGNYVGKDNSFDVGMPLEKYCDWWQILDLVSNYKFELGWHTWSHRDLTKLSDAEVTKEVTPPFPMRYFAYPMGRLDERVEQIVRSVECYEEAWSVHQGNGTVYQQKRRYLNW